MLAAEAIAQFNLEHPNDLDNSRKLFYLKQIEMLIMNEIILTHKIPEELKEKIIAVIDSNKELDQLDIEDKDPVIYIGKEEKVIEPMEYFANFDETFELLVPEPYTEVYIDYIDMKSMYNNRDTDAYNASVVKYNNSYNTFFGYWNRKYLPNKTPLKMTHHALL